MSVPAYSITKDDLPGLKNETERGIEPLLSALNNTIGQLVSAANAVTTPGRNAGSFTTAANGAQYVDITAGQIEDLWCSALQPNDGTVLDSVYSVSWIPFGNGVRVLFVGLVPLTTYTFAVRFE